MARFKYTAKKGPKDVVTGFLEAENKNAALHQLTGMGYFPLSIAKEDVHEGREGMRFFGGRKVAVKDLSIFTRQLADLLEAGLPLVRSLSVLEQQTENRYLRAVVTDLRSVVQDGNPLSDALSRHTAVFSRLYVSMVRSGETGGNLENILLRLAEFQEKQDELTTTVRGAMAYPLLMAGVGILTIFVLVTFVIPKIVSMFQDLNQSLPLPTVLLLNVSYFIRDFWWVLIAAGFILYFAAVRVTKSDEGKFAIDRVKLSVPLFGQLILRSEIARFARTLSTLLSNGVPILESLLVVSNVMENETLKQDIIRAQREVREGAGLAEGLTKGAWIPAFVNNMIAVGEESGILEKSLMKVAISYEREVDKTVKIMTSLLEPIMILTIGLVLGLIVIAMLLPIFEISFISA